MIRKRGSQFARWIDFAVGIPLVYGLSLFRPGPRPRPKHPTRIAVLISAAIGDTIVFSPLLTAIKKKLPHAKIIFFVGPSNRSCLSLFKGMDGVVEIDPHHPFESIRRIRNAGAFDFWFDVGQWPRLNALLTFASRSAYRIGFETQGQYRHYLYDETVLHSNQVHEWINFSRLIRSCIDVDVMEPQIASTREESRHEAILHPYAGGTKPYLKEWPDIKWKKLADTLTERGYHVVLSAGESDHARALELAKLFANPSKVSVLEKGTSLRALANRMATARIVISVNTGAMHLAAATGVKTVGLHGPTSVQRWGPLGENSRGVKSKLGCSPCLNLGFDYGCPKNLCMLEIPVDRVMNAVDELLVGVAVAKPAQERQKKDLQIEVMRPVTDVE